MPKDIQKIYTEFSDWIYDFTFWNEKIIKILFINILIRWSILIEDLPWTGKTTLSKALARLIWYEFKRIQGTSDLTPQDIIWWEFYDFQSKDIVIRKGAIFTELLLIDEINRMNPKTQSAFLQAMEEKKVSIMWIQYEIDDGFFVIATQNPIEHTGTFPLPEAQKDRFSSRISLWYPSDEMQLDIIRDKQFMSLAQKLEKLSQIISKQDIDEHIQSISQVEISETLWKRFIAFFKLIKNSENILYPLSQRGISIFIQWCRAHAYLLGRDYVIPEDGYELIESFLTHRLDMESANAWLLHDLYTQSFKNFSV